MKINMLIKIFSICTLVGIILAFVGIAFGANRNAIFSNGKVTLASQDKKFTTISKTYDIPFTSIDVHGDVSDIQFVSGEKYGFEIDDVNNLSDFTEYDVKNNCLTITAIENLKSNFNVQMGIFSITNGNNRSIIKIFVPKNSNFDSVNLVTNLGSISSKDFNTNSLKVNSQLGSLNLDSISASNGTIDTDSGSIKATNLNLDESKISTNLGSITLDDLKSKNTTITAGSGSIKATNLILDESKVSSNEGSLNVSGDFTGNTKLSSNMGSVKLKAIKPVDFYNLAFSTNIGSTTINGKNGENFTNQPNTSDAPILKVTTNMGSINLDFKN